MADTYTTTRRRDKFSRLMELLSYVAVIFIGLALLISKVWTKLGGDLYYYAELLGYVVVGAFSFLYAFRRRATT